MGIAISVPMSSANSKNRQATPASIVGSSCTTRATRIKVSMVRGCVLVSGVQIIKVLQLMCNSFCGEYGENVLLQILGQSAQSAFRRGSADPIKNTNKGVLSVIRKDRLRTLT